VNKDAWILLLSFAKKSSTLSTVYEFVWIANRVCVTLMAVACEKIRSAAFFALCPRAVHIILGAACTLSHRTHTMLFAIGAYLSAHLLPLLVIIMPGCVYLCCCCEWALEQRINAVCCFFYYCWYSLAGNALPRHTLQMCNVCAVNTL